MGRHSYLSIANLPCFHHRPKPYSTWNCFEVLTDEVPPEEPRHLLRLPGEILNQIYRYVLLSDEDIVIHPQTIPKHTALLQTCRKFRSEGLGIFLAENHFCFVADIQNARVLESWFLAIGSRSSVRFMTGRFTVAEQCTLFGRDDMAWVAAFDDKWAQRTATTPEEIADWNQGCAKMYRMAKVRWGEIQRVWASVAEQLWLHAFPGDVVALPDVKEQEDAKAPRDVCVEDFGTRLRLLREESNIRNVAKIFQQPHMSHCLHACITEYDLSTFATSRTGRRAAERDLPVCFGRRHSSGDRSKHSSAHGLATDSIIGNNATAITSFEIGMGHSKSFRREAEEMERNVASPDREVATRAAQQLLPLVQKMWRQWQEVLAQVAASMRLAALRAEVIRQPMDGLDEQAVRARTIMVDVLKERVQGSAADGRRFDDSREFMRRLAILREKHMKSA
ncbi:uncharacterized protein MYCFIDRAFT_196994 [Pseudocercospora fijiensis CIRAD86]|uniref:F-box domain-containing protein n=1 Tax=Pseudocercospora fijiensis (strain CIRAD86) TaxID=383855 RepID=M3AX37_PSEFD|nr:uncharacterized protein MYCFIDRAFT_196994 [Pseudocercospora fijiensis CIRAD86]EME81658.1 hypothetical protein MYCFIDRAFT_196994 [Pseudocercospora fijiensis CIRAD86]